MNIIFICGSLEPGKDGVGDYTRRLGCELIRLGHNVQIISLNDLFVKSTVTEYQKDSNEEVKVLRLTNLETWSQRVQIAKSFIEKFNPEFLSLQYVPFSFHHSGIHFGLTRRLKELGLGRKWHIMVHEPYIAGKSIGLKRTILGKIQKVNLLSLYKVLQPVVVHTSITYYQNLLSKIKIETKILNLFGNIPADAGIDPDINHTNKNELVTAVFFGAAPKPEHFSFFIAGLKEYVKEGKIKLVLCGNNNVHGDHFTQSLKQEIDSENFEVEKLGVLTVNKLSELFLNVDMGICRVPQRLIGKSGAAISMLEHGLPLWVPLVENSDEYYSGWRKELLMSDLKEIQNTLKMSPCNQLRLTALSLNEDLIKN